MCGQNILKDISIYVIRNLKTDYYVKFDRKFPYSYFNRLYRAIFINGNGNHYIGMHS